MSEDALTGKRVNDKVEFSGKAGGVEWTGTAAIRASDFSYRRLP
jgi:hypothetical protein